MSDPISTWQPTATLAVLHERAKYIQHIRHFFAERNVLEVDTPLLSRFTVTDPHVVGIPAFFRDLGSTKTTDLYLQTSPEYAMKRLLAAGSGPIYQLCKAFRQGDLGTIHNPEFTMLEWYRPGFTHHDLMDEMDELLQRILRTGSAERLSYAAVFEKFLNLNPHTTSTHEIAEKVRDHIQLASDIQDRNTLLDLLLTHCIEPFIGLDRPVFLYDFPVSQAALAKIREEENPTVASRFEVYFKGVELANGFHELQNPVEQRKRFESDLAYRAHHDMPIFPIDELFLKALEHGLPDCAGVALGVDRLIMLALNKQSIRDVLSFGF